MHSTHILTTLLVTGASLAATTPALAAEPRGAEPSAASLRADDPVVPFEDGEGYGDELPEPVTEPDPEPTPPPIDEDDSGAYVSPEPSEQDAGGDVSSPSPRLTIDDRGYLGSFGGGRALYVYFSNPGRSTLRGAMTARFGKTSLRPRKAAWRTIEVEGGDSGANVYALPKRLRRRIARRGSARIDLRVKTAGRTWRQRVTVRRRGRTTAFDGSYTGANGLKFTVAHGYLDRIYVDVNTVCSATGRYEPRLLSRAEGFPAVIGRDGSFSAKGTSNKDTVRYRGRLRRDGTAKGYLSLFHIALNFGDDGTVGSEQCVGASTWTARRTG